MHIYTDKDIMRMKKKMCPHTTNIYDVIDALMEEEFWGMLVRESYNKMKSQSILYPFFNFTEVIGDRRPWLKS